MKKSPKCVYGHECYSVCVNPQCTMPAFMCSTGSKHFDECGAFHETCQRIIWSDIQNVINHNPRKKQEEFNFLQEKFDSLFFSIIKLIQQEHLKFKTWITTFGHGIDVMKFIKNINDENVKHIDGKYMDMVMSELFGGDRSIIQAPRIRDHEVSAYFEKLSSQLQSLSSIYLKPGSNSSQPTSKRASHTTSEQLPKSAQQLIKPPAIIDSVILNDLSQVNHFFDNKIKSLKLLYRASDFYFNIDEFHNRCDNLPHTLTVVENEFGKVIGGYTPLVWNRQKKNWSPDKEQKTFIFSLELREKFKLNLPQFAIANNPERGPIFGCCDLFISDNADKQKSGCEFPISFNNGKFTRKPQTSEVLTGSKTGKFLVKEWEVFSIEFNEPY